MSFAWAWLIEYSYAFVLVAVTLDALAFPLPGRFMLLAAGVLAATGRTEVWGMLAAGVAGAMAGDHLWYFAGRLARGRLQAFVRWLARRGGRAGPDEVDYLHRHGGAVILIGRFVATVRVLVWPVASAHGISYGRFLAWDLGAATLWAGLFVFGGYLLGRPALALMDGWGTWVFVMAGVGVSAFVGGLVWRRRRGRPTVGDRLRGGLAAEDESQAVAARERRAISPEIAIHDDCCATISPTQDRTGPHVMASPAMASEDKGAVAKLAWLTLMRLSETGVVSASESLSIGSDLHTDRGGAETPPRNTLESHVSERVFRKSGPRP